MQTASIQQIRQELAHQDSGVLIDLCLRLSRFKKENKELLTYLLFEASDNDAYIAGIKQEMDEAFDTMNANNAYFVKKTLRKILRSTTKFIQYSNSEWVKIELLIHYCQRMLQMEEGFHRNQVIANLYWNQRKKISKAIGSLHEDLQYDFNRKLDMLPNQLWEKVS